MFTIKGWDRYYHAHLTDTNLSMPKVTKLVWATNTSLSEAQVWLVPKAAPHSMVGESWLPGVDPSRREGNSKVRHLDSETTSFWLYPSTSSSKKGFIPAEAEKGLQATWTLHTWKDWDLEHPKGTFNCIWRWKSSTYDNVIREVKQLTLKEAK